MWLRGTFRIPDCHLRKTPVDSGKVSCSLLQDVKKEIEQLSAGLGVFA
jgi:hypothetical protein